LDASDWLKKQTTNVDVSLVVENCGDVESRSILDKGLLSDISTVGEALPSGPVSSLVDLHQSVPSTFQFVSNPIDSPLPSSPPIVGHLLSRVTMNQKMMSLHFMRFWTPYYLSSMTLTLRFNYLSTLETLLSTLVLLLVSLVSPINMLKGLGKSFTWSRGLGIDYSPVKMRSARKKSIVSTPLIPDSRPSTDSGALRAMKALARAK
jgi:hypothetical protein